MMIDCSQEHEDAQRTLQAFVYLPLAGTFILGFLYLTISKFIILISNHLGDLP